MVDLSPLVVLMGVLTVSVIVLTAVAVIAALEVRRLARGVESVLPQCRAVARDLRKVMAQAQALIAVSSRAAGRVDSVVGRACSAADGAMDQWTMWKESMEEWFRGRAGNAARSGGSRRQSRRLS